MRTWGGKRGGERTIIRKRVEGGGEHGEDRKKGYKTKAARTNFANTSNLLGEPWSNDICCPNKTYKEEETHEL